MALNRLLTSGLLLGLVLAGPVGAATAGDGTEPSAETTPAATTPSPGTDPAPSPDTGAEPENQPPVAEPDEAAVDAGEAVTVRVLDNDTDDGLPEGSTLTVVGVGNGGGRLSFTADTVTFDARADDAGDYLVRYQVSDGELTSTGDLSVRVTPSPQRFVTISLAKGPVALRSYPIDGRVGPQALGARATVTVQRRTPKGWTRFARTTADREGRWSVRFRTDQLGERVLRAKAAYVDGGRATSPVIRRTVTARADVAISGPLTRKQVPHSWRSGCPVAPSGLRKLSVNRLDYRKRISRGTIVVAAGATGTIADVFSSALDKRFPIRRMQPADAFYAGGRRTPMESDKAAMRAGNTSAFNCRPVVGNPYRLSQHSYGNAIDINTIENPYVTNSHVYPAGSRGYLDRSPYRRGMILRNGVIANRMRAHGWLWGARWSNPDYQHFSSNGG